MLSTPSLLPSPSSSRCTSPPGAIISTVAPKFEYRVTRWPRASLAATVITLLQLAGETCDASTASFPAATTTAAPAATAASMAACLEGDKEQGTPGGVPRLMLITLAGVVLFGTPGTARPAAQRTASLISAVVPPHLPSTRTGCTLTAQLTPATPRLLLVLPTPTVPATWVPCHEGSCAGWGGLPSGTHSLAATPSPGSVGILSRPSPSFAMNVLLIMSKPATKFGPVISS